MKQPQNTDTPIERLSGSVERVTFHSEESGFCVLRTKVKGQRDVAPFVKEQQMLAIWSHDFFRDVAKRIRIVGEELNSPETGFTGRQSNFPSSGDFLKH